MKVFKGVKTTYEKILHFIDYILEKLKNPKELFEELLKLLESIFGVVKKVDATTRGILKRFKLTDKAIALLLSYQISITKLSKPNVFSQFPQYAVVYDGKKILEGTKENVISFVKEVERIAEQAKNKNFDDVKKYLDDLDISLNKYLEKRTNFFKKGKDEITKLWNSLVKSKHLNDIELIALYRQFALKYPGIVAKGMNVGKYNIKIQKNGKLVENIQYFSVSGQKDDIIRAFGGEIPDEVLDIYGVDYPKYEKFVENIEDFNGRPRGADSEMKVIYDVLQNHLSKGDEFIIETTNIFRACDSCRTGLLSMMDSFKDLSKKIEIYVKSNDEILGSSMLTKHHADLKKIQNKAKKDWKQLKKDNGL